MPARRSNWWYSRVFGFPEKSNEYDRSRTFFQVEEDYPGPKTMGAAARFLAEDTPHHDRWFLFVDEFDPHEPFDTPEPWAGRYHEEVWDEDWILMPPYADGALTTGDLSEREARHVRANYGAKLAMIDHWFGRILERFDEQGLWDNTALIVCTDHGHYFGDVREGQDIWGKPGVPTYGPLAHTPLLIHWPGQPGGRVCDALTTNVDVFATVDDNFPLSMWSNRWSTMPLGIEGVPELPMPDDRAWLDTMPGTEIPVIRQPFQPGDMLPFWASAGNCVDRHFLFDLDVDPDEQENRSTEWCSAEMLDLLHTALTEVEAPDDQLARLGIA